MAVSIILLSSFLVVVLIFYTCPPKSMGGLPKGEHKERIRRSPNYSDGRFQNRNHTPFMTEGFWKTISQPSRRNLKPENEVPVQEETLQAGIDLRAKYIIPVHHSKFSISSHRWEEPLQRISAANEKLPEPQQILTPKIGEIVFLNKRLRAQCY